MSQTLNIEAHLPVTRLSVASPGHHVYICKELCSSVNYVQENYVQVLVLCSRVVSFLIFDNLMPWGTNSPHQGVRSGTNSPTCQEFVPLTAHALGSESLFFFKCEILA